MPTSHSGPSRTTFLWVRAIDDPQWFGARMYGVVPDKPDEPVAAHGPAALRIAGERWWAAAASP